MSKKPFNPNDFQPKRFGLRYNPPQIVLEYTVPSNNKMYHHKIKLPKLKVDSNLQEIIKEVYEKHSTYLDPNHIPQTQVLSM